MLYTRMLQDCIQFILSFFQFNTTVARIDKYRNMEADLKYVFLIFLLIFKIISRFNYKGRSESFENEELRKFDLCENFWLQTTLLVINVPKVDFVRLISSVIFNDNKRANFAGK